MRLVLRFIRRKIMLIICIVALFASLKLFLPKIGQQIGNWISGTQDSRVMQAFSEMLGSFSDGIGEAVEVFCDGLQKN